MNKIIVPTDFSEHAQKAYPIAAAIAKKNGVTVELFSIQKERLVSYAGYGVFAIGHTYLDNLLDEHSLSGKLQEHANLPVFDGVEVEIKEALNFGNDLAADIYNHINSGDYSLAVIGTEGVDKKSETFAEVIARHADIPIITAKSSSTKFAPKKVVLCTDFENVSPNYLRSLKSILTDFDAKITLLYINTPSDFKDTEEINKAFKLFKHLYNVSDKVELVHYNAYTVSDGITKFLRNNSFDLVSMSTHGRTGLSHLFKGSITEDFINESEVPVFSYNLHDYNSRRFDRTSKSSAPATRGFTG